MEDTAPQTGSIAFGFGRFDRIVAAVPPVLEGTPTLLVPAGVESVLAEGCSQDLPLCQIGVDANGVSFKRFELPGTAADERSRHSQTLKLSLRWLNGISTTVRVTVEDSLSASGINRQGTYYSAEHQAAAGDTGLAHPLEEVVDGHIDFVNECFADQPQATMTWEGCVGGKSIRSLSSALSIWRDLRSSSEPRLSLIVKLAEDLPRLLTNVCERPRVVLNRVRQMVPASRVQQVDAACLRWLARQPGKTVAEKAGPTQRILAVNRREQSDTHENRVVRDLLCRAIRAADRYVREHAGALSHARVASVIRFRSLLRRLLIDSPLAGVNSLSGRPQPNYVLQQDARYRPLWEAYVKLVRQQMLQDQVWRWRSRLWTEHCAMGLFDALDNLSVRGSAQRADLVLNMEQSNGTFLHPRVELPTWTIRVWDQEFEVDSITHARLDRHPAVPELARELNPDLALIRRGSDQIRIGLLYCLATSRQSVPYLELENQIACRLASSQATRNFRCLFILPDGPDSPTDMTPSQDSVRSIVYRAEQGGRQVYTEAIRWLVGLPQE